MYEVNINDKLERKQVEDILLLIKGKSGKDLLKEIGAKALVHNIALGYGLHIEESDLIKIASSIN